jgi:hypothetical protein
MASSGMLRRVDLVRTDVSEELSASFIRVTRIGELGTALAVTSNRRTLRRLLVPPKRRFLQEAHGVTFRKTPSFNMNVHDNWAIVTTVIARPLMNGDITDII